MKCPFCNFLNSNTRNYCLRCNADLTELKIEFGLSGNPTEDAGEKEEVKQNIDLPKIPVPKVILKSSSQKQIASLQSRIANLQKGHSFEATPVGSSQTQTLVPIEISEFEDNSVESSMTKDEVSELIAESQSTVTTDNHDDEFQLRFMNISYDLEKRMERWRIILNPKIRSSYDDLINSFPDHSDEFEIGPQSQLSEKKKLNIEQLYVLHLKATTENRNSIKDYQKSHTRSLDRNLLNQKYKELKTDLLATEDESLEKDFKEESNNLPIPESRTIIFAAFIDLVVTLISTLAFVGLLPIVKNKNYNPNHIFDLLKANVL